MTTNPACFELPYAEQKFPHLQETEFFPQPRFPPIPHRPPAQNPRPSACICGSSSYHYPISETSVPLTLSCNLILPHSPSHPIPLSVSRPRCSYRPSSMVYRPHPARLSNLPTFKCANVQTFPSPISNNPPQPWKPSLASS
jgi:hypothetical protein